MRFRIPLVVLLACSVAWLGCDERAGTDSVQGPAPSFASGGPTPDACDLKDLPVRDYFPKDALKVVNGLVRDLSDACAEGRSEDALQHGFDVLTMVDTLRSDEYAFGGDIVAGVWTAMQYSSGLKDEDSNEPIACLNCAHADVIDTEVAEALESGAFGVRGGTDGHVASLGEYPDIWGIEPDGATWVLPLDKALIYGVPLAYGVLPGEKPLTFGYDWNVVAWWLVPTRDTKPLLVGTCVPSTGANVPLVSHEPVGRGPTLLPKGDPPTYCGPNVTLGSRLLHLASLAVPLWPQPLNATAMVGVSGSGKAREFSPFHHYEMSQFADAEISQPAAVTKLGDPICFETFSDPDTGDDTRDTSVEDPSCNFAFDWVTARGEGTGGNPTGSLETFVISAVDNNGAKTVISFTEPPLDGECRQGGEASQLICECDGRAVEGAPCDRIELQGLTLSKTGVFSICVEDLGGTESSGLTIRACTEDFHIKPNG